MPEYGMWNLVVIPCKPGERVYCVETPQYPHKKHQVKEYEVGSLSITKFGVDVIPTYKLAGCNILCHASDFGNTVFTSIQQAYDRARELNKGLEVAENS